MILEGLNNYYKCKQCAKQFLCEKCTGLVKFSQTKRLWNTRKEREMKIGEEKTLIEIINEIAKGKIKKDLKLHYEYGLTYHLYIDDLKLIAYNGTGLYIGKVLNDKFKLEGYYNKNC